MQAKQAAAVQTLEEYIEEHAGEDGLLADALNDSGNITASSVKARLKVIQGEPDSKDEREALTSCVILINATSKISRAVKKEQEALDSQVLAHYATLTEAEIKTLVVEDKWVASVQSAIDGEVQRVTQALTERVKNWKNATHSRCPTWKQEVKAFSAKVEEHLKNGMD